MGKRKIDNEKLGFADAGVGVVGTDVPMLALDVNDIHVDAARNQRHFAPSKEEIEGLAKSIIERGQIQPVAVRECTNGETGKKYELLLGFQRVTAIRYANTELGKSLPVLARVLSANDEDALLLNLDENLRRKNLTLMDVAFLIQGMREKKMELKEIGKKFGKGSSWVSQHSDLVNLRPHIQKQINDGKLLLSHARALSGLTDKQQDEMLEGIAKGTLKTSGAQAERGKKKKRDKRGRKASKVPTIKAVQEAFEMLATPPAKPKKGAKAVKETTGQVKRRKIAALVRLFLFGRVKVGALGKALEKLA